MLVIVGEDREPVVIETRREVGDVDAEHEVADAHRLVPGSVSGVSSSSMLPSPRRS